MHGRLSDPPRSRVRKDPAYANSSIEQENPMSPDAPQPYGAITLTVGKKAAAPALAEASRNNWAMAVAVVDGAGDLVYFERMDATQSGSVVVAIDKARSAARFKRSTKVFQDMLAAGGEGWRVLGLQGAVPVEGGVPI